MIHLAFRRVRPDQLERLKAWFAEAQERVAEVRETLAAEGVSHEQGFLLETSDGTIFVSVIECEDYDAAAEIFKNSELPIDIEHREIMSQLFDGAVELTPIFDVRR